MKVVSKKFLMLGFLVLFFSAFVGGGIFTNDALAQMNDKGVGGAIIEAGKAGGVAGAINIDPTISSGASGGSGLQLGGGCPTGNPFSLIACKAAKTLNDLRVIVYVISGFGLIAFTFSAIFGKISWKHLAQLGFALFLLSMMAPFIEYFTGDSKYSINGQFGNYLPSGNHAAYMGSSNSFSKTDCGSNCPEEVIDENLSKDPNAGKNTGNNTGGNGGDVTGGEGGNNNSGGGGTNTADNSGNNGSSGDNSGNGNGGSSGTLESGKSIGESIKSGIDAAKAGIDLVNSAKVAAQDIATQRDRIKDALKNKGKGIGGLLDAGGKISGAGERISDIIYRGGKNAEYNSGKIKEGIDDVSDLLKKKNPPVEGGE